jgi:hypothetical protein
VTAAITTDATAIDAADLDAALAAVPERWPDDDPAIEPLIDAEVAALASAAAADSLARDTYWPKWDSPWWQMALLDELGRTDRIPTSAVTAMVAGLAALPSHGFPHDAAGRADSTPASDSRIHRARTIAPSSRPSLVSSSASLPRAAS